MYGQYNILSEIESPYSEAFHSNMLASLLKEPQILQAFLEHLPENIGIPSKDLIDATVDTEFVCPESQNRIDILIRLKFKPSGQTTPLYKAIILENKIYAKDQPQQLDNYFAALKGLGYPVKDILLVYLTLEGNAPSADSFCTAKKENASLAQLSYQEHIISFLKSSLTLDTVKQSSRLKNTIESYKELLVEYLLPSYDTSSRYDTSTKELVWEFVNELETRVLSLLKENYNFPDLDKPNDSFLTCEKEKFLSFFPESLRSFGFNVPLKKFTLNNKDATIYFCIEIEDFIYFGLSLQYDGDFSYCDSKKNHELLKGLSPLLDALFKEGFYNHSNWLGWKYFNLKITEDKYVPKLKLLDDKSLATLQDGAKRAALIKAMIDNIDSHLCALEPRLPY
ncbi:PD-(D/E)XK nuclease family protein [Anaerobiospirillum sp. NML120448]|uniref:PD-(D/E)XK nuclease family protein n=1 Tax=Anaerobiospirillum sp. NML120448 TaxID=2932816 RepID=UPI001FF14213|nr:PD-(D/E)XK nuclease family protein [Anaerobiospirillum sp. NML120448]MCK0515427.1 PD-(D/E)XK nuclease family protein [Anaerobiospirillum sp. NML120448]